MKQFLNIEMSFNFVKKYQLIVISLIVLLVAYFYFDLKSYLFKANEPQLSVEQSIINSWKHYVNLPKRKSTKNIQIAIGMNTNVDLILSGTSLLNALNISNTIDSKNHGTINDLKQFKECFKYFFQKGSAAERSFEKLTDFQHVLSHTNDLKKQIEIGGNAALMAHNIASKFNNIDVLLIGPIGSKLKSLLNKRILIPFDSDLYEDETHLILEYGINEEFENVNAPAANRFIVSHDIKNSEMAMLNDFFNVTNVYQPDIIIIAGLHLIESLNMQKRLEKINALINHLKQNTLNNLVHLELASIGSIEFMETILDTNIFNHVNSLGLNEQELLFTAHSSTTAPHSNYYKEIKGQPELKKVIDILEWILNNFGQNYNKQSKLTRIHFHCLIYHIVATIDNNEWSNTKQSLVAGTKIASKQACGLEFDNKENEINLKDDVRLKMNYEEVNKKIAIKYDEKKKIEIDLNEPIVEIKRGNIKFQMTPVLVCKEPKRTVGLGDSISSVGLVYSCFKNC